MSPIKILRIHSGQHNISIKEWVLVKKNVRLHRTSCACAVATCVGVANINFFRRQLLRSYHSALATRIEVSFEWV